MQEQDFRKKLEKAAGRIDFPHRMYFDRDGNVTKFEYEKEWQSGTTEPVEDDDGNIVDYKPNYKKEKLTEKQVKAIDELIKTLG